MGHRVSRRCGPLRQAGKTKGEEDGIAVLYGNSGQWHVQAGAQHTDHSYADVINIGTIEPPDYELAPYSTYDAFQTLTTTNRPRVLGVRFSYQLGNKTEH